MFYLGWKMFGAVYIRVQQKGLQGLITESTLSTPLPTPLPTPTITNTIFNTITNSNIITNTYHIPARNIFK